MAIIKVKPYSPDHGDFVIMEEESFVEGVHERYEDDSTIGDMNIAQIKDALTAAGISFPAAYTKKADLLALLPKD